MVCTTALKISFYYFWNLIFVSPMLCVLEEPACWLERGGVLWRRLCNGSMVFIEGRLVSMYVLCTAA